VLGFVAVWIGLSAHDARNDAKKAAAASGSMAGMDMSGGATGSSELTSYAGQATLLNRAWVNAGMTRYQRNVQTVLVPAGGGGVFDVKIDQPGLYPFVSHSFAAVDLGQVGLLNVGNVKGTMSH
jgi:hypothetical protein